MGIKYVNEHLDCDCYAGGKKQLIRVIDIEEGSSCEHFSESNSIVFILSGRIEIALHEKTQRLTKKGDFFFIPASISISCHSIKKSKVLIARTEESLHLCQSFHVEDLFNEVKYNRIQSEAYKLRILRMNEHLWDYAKVMEKLLGDQLKCINLLKNKIEELMILLRAYYDKEDLRDFFYFLLNPNSVFVEFVRKNWRKYKTVYDISSAMNLSPQYFSKRFKEIFNKAPSVWLQEQKAELILIEIQGTTKPFQQIAEEFGFSSQPHFNRFCNKMFNKNPNALRKQKSVLVMNIPRKI